MKRKKTKKKTQNRKKWIEGKHTKLQHIHTHTNKGKEASSKWVSERVRVKMEDRIRSRNSYCAHMMMILHVFVCEWVCERARGTQKVNNGTKRWNPHIWWIEFSNQEINRKNRHNRNGEDKPKRNDNKILQPKAHAHTVANTYTHASEWQAKLHENHFWCCLFSARQWPLQFFEYRKADTRAHTIHQKIWRPLHRPRKKSIDPHILCWRIEQNRIGMSARVCMSVRACVWMYARANVVYFRKSYVCESV